MPDLLATISSNYVAVGASTNYGTSKYVDVDKTLYQGTWAGKYADNSKFSIQVSDVQGFRAKVKYENGSLTKFQDVLIKDNAFRIGDSKFTLKKVGLAEVKTVMTKNGGSTLETAYAKQG